MNRYSTGRRSKQSDLDAAARLTRLRHHGIPLTITNRDAWYLSGGVVGDQNDPEGTVPLARIAKDVPDAENFIQDYTDQW